MTKQTRTMLKEMLVEELDNVVHRMRHEPDPARKLFLFSAAYGMADRVMRLSYDSELLFVQNVLNHVYGSFMNRLNAITHGDSVVPLGQQHFDRLADLTEELSEKIKKGEPTHLTLEKFNELAFITTGAGHYMRMNEKL